MTSFFISGRYSVSIAGQDVTSRFSPILKSLQIQRSAGQASDTCDLTLADPGGQVFLPRDRASVVVALNGLWAFEGFVSDVSCSISKSAGREIKISASSVDHGSKAKEPSLRHKDDASLGDVAKEWGAKAGLDVEVIGSLKDVHRDYWLMQNESFASWAQRVAREVGGTLKIIGSRAYLSPRNEGISASGRTLTPIRAAVGDNLISAEISPIISRPKYSKVAISYFDRSKGERVEVEVDTGISDVDTKLRELITAANEAEAKKKGEARAKESDRQKGGGTVTIVGNALAEPEAVCTVSGVRPGIDGSYQIDTVDHSVDKSSGFVTTIGLKQPKNGAGVDSR